MEAHLCSMCTSVALYPQAQQEEDQHGRLLGYVELNCKTDCNVDTLRLRLMGRSRSHANAALDQGPSMFRNFLMEEAILFNVHTGERTDVSEQKRFPKGKHIMAYEFMIPATMRSSQDNLFEKVTYEVTLYVRGRPSKSIFGKSFTRNPVQSVAVEVHPSPAGIQGLNTTAVKLRQTSQDSRAGEIHATLSSNNARFGGCFNLMLHRPVTNKEDRIEIVDLSLTLQQFWITRGERANESSLSSIIADMSSLKTDYVEVQDLKTISDEGELSAAVGLQGSLSKRIGRSAEPPSYQEISDECHVQRIKFHDYFPNCTEPGSDKAVEASEARKLNTGWQASTPSRTQDDVRIEHNLTLVVKYFKSEDSSNIEQVTLTAPITLVSVSLELLSLSR